jgi:hypothetical protein
MRKTAMYLPNVPHITEHKKDSALENFTPLDFLFWAEVLRELERLDMEDTNDE